MARKKPEEDPDDHNRWIVSYADFITLLFALFAVMYAMSSLNAEKYAAMSASMMTAFSRLPPSLKTASSNVHPSAFKILPNPNEFTVGNLEAYDPNDLWWAAPLSSPLPFKPATNFVGVTDQESDKPESGAPSQPAATSVLSQGDTPAPEVSGLTKENVKNAVEAQEIERAKEEMSKIADDIKSALGPMIQLGNVTVTQSELGVSVEIDASILFNPGKARLNAKSIRALSALAHILSTGSHRIHVEGYTDNIAVNNSQFLSNWELSAHRAATVAHLFTDNGIPDGLLTAIGHGKNDPVDTNDTAQGRAHNRRVMVSILPSKGITSGETAPAQ